MTLTEAIAALRAEYPQISSLRIVHHLVDSVEPAKLQREGYVLWANGMRITHHDSLEMLVHIMIGCPAMTAMNREAA